MCLQIERIRSKFRHVNSLDGGKGDSVAMRFFLSGESEDRKSQDVASSRGFSAFSTTVLHEAVKASNYVFVESVVRQGFPVHIRDSDNRTALDLAIARRETRTNEQWRLINNWHILSLLEQDPRAKKPFHESGSMLPFSPVGIELPYGWQQNTFQRQNGYEVTLFSELSVDLESPSITTGKPEFSFLTEASIALGPREIAGDCKAYHLDLVRFMRRRDFQDSHWNGLSDRRGTFQYDDEWYHNDIRMTNTPPSLVSFLFSFRSLRYPSYSLALYRMYGRVQYATDLSLVHGRSWLRRSYVLWYCLYIVLVQDYTNILLLFVPLNIAAQIIGWKSDTVLTFGILAVMQLTSIWNFLLRECLLKSRPSMYQMSIYEALLEPLPEAFVTCDLADRIVSDSISRLLSFLFYMGSMAFFTR